MARPKSALRQKLEEIAIARQREADAAAAAAASNNSAANSSTAGSVGSPAYTEASLDSTVTGSSRTTVAATPASDTTAATPYSTSTSTCAIREEDPASRQLIASELERLSLLGPAQINVRNWDFSSSPWQEMLSSASPSYTAHWDNFPRALTFWENVEGSRAMAERDPGYAMEVEQIGSDVDEVEGRASVFMQLRVMEGGVCFQGMSTLTWERVEGEKWLCTRHDGYRAGNAGFD